MSCPSGTLSSCDFGQFLVQQTPVFDELIIEDITVIDGWLGNISTYQVPMGTPTEITQDRFRGVWPNTTKPWTKTQSGSCLSNPCDPAEHQIGWGSDRLTYFEEEITYTTPLMCYDQMMNVTAAQQQLGYIISDILKPATSAIMSAYLRKRALFWGQRKTVANSSLTQFTYQWNLDAQGNEAYFDCNVAPTNVYKLVPQMLQNRFSPLMRLGYAGKNPFKETAPFIELVTDMDTAWSLDKLGGQQGVGTGNNPSVSGNWRFTQWDAANAYWRYGFSGQIGNFMTRVDELGLRFNFVGQIAAGVNGNGNIYRYQIIQPYLNEITTGAGGSAGLGRDANPDFDRAQYAISFISHKKGLELGVYDARAINPEMPFLHPNFGGKWQFLMHDLGADINGVAISNKWGNKGQFGARWKNYIRPLHTEFLESFFHKREQFCIPNIGTCATDPGYPAQTYNSKLPTCPLPTSFAGLYAGGVPSGSQDGPVPMPEPPSPPSVT